MKKSDLIDAMRDLPDDAEIGCFWDGESWDIRSVLTPAEAKIRGGELREDPRFRLVIDCE